MTLRSLSNLLFPGLIRMGVVEETAAAEPEAATSAPEGDEEQQAQAAEDAPADGQQAEGSAEPAEAAADEVIVTIGDAAPADEDADHQQAPAWVKDLRKANREKDRAIRERDAEIARLKGAAAPAPVVLGAKPTLQGCDFDEAKFESELEAWHARKAELDAQAAAKAKTEEAQRNAWQAKLDAFARSKAALRVADFDDAEEAVDSLWSVTQRGILIQGAGNPAALKYALGKNPAEAKRLAAITDPVLFTWALAQLESKVKIQARKPATAPEKVAPRSSMSGASAVDNELARLQAQADKTGDRSQVVRYLQGRARQAA